MFDRKTLERFEKIARQMHDVADQMRADGCDEDMIHRMYMVEIRGLAPRIRRDFVAYLGEPG